MDLEKLSLLAINAAILAGEEIMKIYNSEDFGVVNKDDESPLTKADLAANQIITEYLDSTNIPMITEEVKALSYEERKNWRHCWIIDPLDGTKEFIRRNGEFTVNIALIKDNQPLIGVIYVPVTNELFYGNVETKLFYNVKSAIIYSSFNDFKSEDSIEYGVEDSANVIKVVGSKSHMNVDTLKFIENLKSKNPEKAIEVVSKGSSLKFCMVAVGQADIYPRFAPTMEWDTAAGQAICEASGKVVIDQSTNQPMRYNRENLLNSYFLVTNL